MKNNVEFESLNNFAQTLGLTLHYYSFEDKRKNAKYHLSLNGTSVSPVLNYIGLNCFMNGWLHCMKTKPLN